MSHTPGPWRSVYDGSSDWSIGEEDDPQDRRVAHVGRRGGLDTWNEAAANALLIAAAPDLLDALMQAREILPDCDNSHVEDVLAVVRAAIAKAEGR